jgi:hypothetical protein
MAEINKITIFKDGSGNPSYGLVDSQHRVVVTFDSAGVSSYKSGNSGAVVAGVDFNVVSYTVPAGKIFTITKWEASGQAHAVFKLMHGSYIISQKRNSVAEPNVFGECGAGLDMAAGTVITIKVNHFENGKTIDFFGTIFGNERTA